MQQAEQHFEKANELLKRMDFQGAITEYNKVISLSSNRKNTQDAQYWIGQSHFRAGRFDAAKATFAKLIEQYPTSAIIPVTKLMVERVEKAKENEKIKSVLDNAADKGFVINPKTGVRYTKTASFAGKNDVIVNTINNYKQSCLKLSPNGKFLLNNKLVVPLDGSEPFDLVDTPIDYSVWAPDGSKVAFCSEDSIWIVPVSPETSRPTGPARKLFEEERLHTLLSQSPDGENMVFCRRAGPTPPISGREIWSLSINNGSTTQITSGLGRIGGAIWSPDGKDIVFGMREGYRQSYWMVSAKSGTPTKIVEPEGKGKYRHALSPDGKWLLYTKGGKIHLFGLNDKRELSITPPQEIIGDFFSWSADGKKMLFYRPSYEYRYGVKVVSTAGGPPFAIGSELCELHLFPKQWSADSRMIVGIGGSTDGRYGTWLIPLSGGESVFFEVDVPFDRNLLHVIGIFPNLEKLAFGVKRDDGMEDLYVMPISFQDARTTGTATKVFAGLSRESGINVTTSWSPDGDKIAVIHKWDVWIASSNGEEAVQVTNTPEQEVWPGWSPDGKMMTYLAGPVGSERIFHVRSVAGGSAFTIPGASYISVWSPDSRYLVIQSEEAISVVSVADGETQQIAKLKDLGLEEVFDFSWSPDGSRIACVGRHVEKGDAGPIVIIPVAGGEATTLVNNDTSNKYYLSWSPDGRWISYNSEGSVKMRPEGTMWEADFDQILKKISR